MRSVVAFCLLAAACEMPATMVDGPNDSFLAGDGKADTGGIAEGSPDALAVLALVNGADLATLDGAVGLDGRAAKNIVADRPFDTLKALDAVPYVGTIAFAKLLAYVHTHPAPPSSGGWASSLPPGPFALDVQVNFPATTQYCQPSCLTRKGSGDVVLHLARGADGAVTMGFTALSYYTYPARPVPADGRFERGEGYYAHGEGSIVFDGHFEPGRVVVIDDYSWDYTSDNGMFNGWTTDMTSTGAGRATF